MAVSLSAETWVAITRLQEILVLDEKEKPVIEKTVEKDISFCDVNASWIPNTPTLNNLNVIIPEGTLCAIIGPVGSGKSSILQVSNLLVTPTVYTYLTFDQLLLGELCPNSGHIKVGGSLAYASQEPWLFAASVRKNILFGRKYDSSLYKTVTDVCALEKDFQQLPYGDRTLVGERGVSLSGGQRARINLARAIYRNADIYLLDDPLSAVDTHVGKHLFEKCIVNYLKGKTRILVTHQLQYLKKADMIVVLSEVIKYFL